jgi:hypothetical protein
VRNPTSSFRFLKEYTLRRSLLTLGAFALGAMLVVPTGAPAQTILVKKGTIVCGTLQQTLSSKTAHDGDTFTLIEKDTWFHRTPAGPTHKATMSIIFDDVRLPENHLLRDTGVIVGAAVVGHVAVDNLASAA